MWLNLLCDGNLLHSMNYYIISHTWNQNKWSIHIFAVNSAGHFVSFHLWIKCHFIHRAVQCVHWKFDNNLALCMWTLHTLIKTGIIIESVSICLIGLIQFGKLHLCDFPKMFVTRSLCNWWERFVFAVPTFLKISRTCSTQSSRRQIYHDVWIRKKWRRSNVVLTCNQTSHKSHLVRRSFLGRCTRHRPL